MHNESDDDDLAITIVRLFSSYRQAKNQQPCKFHSFLFFVTGQWWPLTSIWPVSFHKLSKYTAYHLNKGTKILFNKQTHKKKAKTYNQISLDTSGSAGGGLRIVVGMSGAFPMTVLSGSSYS